MNINETTPLVSVVIPTYNRANYIGEAVESVLAQTYKNIEVIIVDDGSTDDTKKVLEPYMDQIVYIHQENRGPSIARNTGIQQAKGPYIAFLDSDDLWLAEKLEIQLAFLDENPEFELVHSGFLLLEEGPNGNVLKKWPHAQHWPSGDIFPQMFLQPMVQPTTVLCRCECFEVAGLFDSEFKGTEDYEMWLRIARRCKIGYIDKELAIYRQHGVNLTTNRIRLIEETVSMIHKLLQKDSKIWNDLGPSLVKRGLFKRHFALAYALLDAGDLKTARQHFAHSIQLQPVDWRSYGYYFSCFLPPLVVQKLRQTKRAIRHKV